MIVFTNNAYLNIPFFMEQCHSVLTVPQQWPQPFKQVYYGIVTQQKNVIPLCH
jgi:hypothetical protein